MHTGGAVAPSREPVQLFLCRRRNGDRLGAVERFAMPSTFSITGASA
ncbi:MAG: hypothetical protein CM15mP79_2320 [Methanobacteriota archaeon]|nr:MAG: hypothetical protein CM15mP79_2320 [Euryarchaeota archaeon]